MTGEKGSTSVMSIGRLDRFQRLHAGDDGQHRHPAAQPLGLVLRVDLVVEVLGRERCPQPEQEADDEGDPHVAHRLGELGDVGWLAGETTSTPPGVSAPVTWSWASCSFKTASWLASAEIVAVVPADGEVSLSSGLSWASSAAICALELLLGGDDGVEGVGPLVGDKRRWRRCWRPGLPGRGYGRWPSG